MPKSLSLDLRERVVAAVDAGLSRRAAAERFGVSIASAVRWCARARDTGAPRAKPQGGDRHSHRIEAIGDLILAIVARTRDITLVEVQAEMAAQGHRVAIGTLWRFLNRHGITWKKRPRTPPSRTAPTS